MHILIGIFCLLIFLFSLYILGKDDYFLIRKNFFMEHLFDFIFAGIFFGILFARIVTVFIAVIEYQGRFAEISVYLGKPFTMTEIVFGCILSFYIIGKYKKFPLGRLFDFIAYSFLVCLPLWYFLQIFFLKRTEALFHVGLGIFYAGVLIFFWKLLLPEMHRSKLRDGTLSSLLLLIYSFAGLAVSFIYRFRNPSLTFETQDLLLIFIFIVSLTFLFQTFRKRVIRRRI